MIHSMCGGKLKEGSTVVFAKVKLDSGETKWFLVEDMTVSAGDRVIVPTGYLRAEGEVVEARECKVGVTPIPLRTAQSIVAKV